MSLLARMRELLMPRAGDPAMDDRYFSMTGPVATAGVVVTPETAMRVSAVYRCVSLLANAFASLPFGTFRRMERGRSEVDHIATRIFTVRPNPYQVPFAFKRMLMGHLVLRGNAYARIVRKSNSTELWPLHPDRMSGPELLQSGRLRYRYRRPDNGREDTFIGGQDILHLTGLSSDGLRGLSTADIAQDTIGFAMATEQHGSRLFSQGVRLAGVLKYDQKMDDALASTMSRRFRETWGGQKGAFGVPVLEQGMDFQSIGMTNEDSQFLETRRFEVSDIARWFGIPPHMIGDVERSTSWGSGIESQSIQFVTYGLVPWLVLWEQAIRETLIPEPDLYARFNVNALLRADAKTRHEIYEIGIRTGMYSPNDCREHEDENPRPGGDVYADPRNANGPPGGGRLDEPSPEKDEDEPEQATGTAFRMIEGPIAVSQHVLDMLAALKASREPDESGDVALAGLAASRAAELLAEEEPMLVKAAQDHGGDSKAWRGWLASFYGRRAIKIAKALACSQDDARSYCAKRRDRIIVGGLAAAGADGWVEELAALAAGVKTC